MRMVEQMRDRGFSVTSQHPSGGLIACTCAPGAGVYRLMPVDHLPACPLYNPILA